MLRGFLLSFLVGVTLAGVPWIPEPRDENWLIRHEGFVNNSLINGENMTVLFYGDSITDAWDSTGRAVFDIHYRPLGTAEYGIGGDRTEHVLWRIINGEVQNLSPKICVLKIGTNNLGANTDFDIARGVSAIIDQLRSRLPAMRILLLGVLPRTNEATTNRTENINSMISIFDNGDTVRYLNMRDTFYRGAGQFNLNLYTEDLLHLQLAGYEAWQGAMDSLFQEIYNM